MVSGAALPVTIGSSVSQCAETVRIARGSGSARASPDQAAPAAPGSTAVIGEPCERNSVGIGVLTGPPFARCRACQGASGLAAGLDAARLLHRGPPADTFHVGADRR